MPASTPLPTIDDFLDAYAASVRAEAGTESNTRRGSGYDKLGGSSALLWARQAQRDRDLFRQCYVETASGDALEERVERKYGVSRTKASYGTGAALIERSVAGTDGTIYTGTRILVTTNEGRPRQYAVSDDVDVSTTDTVVQLPVRATKIGTGVAITVTSGLRLGDSVFDSTFSPTYLTCADGTEDEPPAEYIDRARKNRLDNRVGYKKRVEAACREAGAANVVILDADTFDDDPDVDDMDDFGVTHVYVSDSGFASPQSLLDACFLAVDAVHVAGCDAQVLGMAITPVTVTLTATLWDSPGAFNQVALKSAMADALLAEFNKRPEFWVFRHDALRGAVIRTSTAIQELEVSTSPSEPAAAFVAVLPRYTLAGTDIAITLQGPT